MTLGVDDKKKLRWLAVCGVGLAGAMYYSFFSGPDVPSAPAPTARTAVAPAPTAAQPAGPPSAPRGTTARSRSEEFRPALRSKRANEAAIDPSRIDPTLRTDLLARVQAVELAGGSRNVFQFGAAPAKVEPLKGPEPIVAPKRAFVGPIQPPPPEPPKPRVDPPPPPIPLKFYGYTTARDNGKKTAYFLHNEDIILAAEGETVERRYRVIRINATSVVMEDTEVKKQQTLPLVEEAQGE